MNAKKAKKLRQMARKIAKTQFGTEVPETAQVKTTDGVIINTSASVRGIYQYLQNTEQFMKRY